MAELFIPSHGILTLVGLGFLVAGIVSTFQQYGQTAGTIAVFACLISLPIFYFAEGTSYVIVGSVGGRARHADWYHNLLANPHAWVHIKRQRIPVTAVVLTGEERTQVWERVSAEFPNYTEYQERAQPREIPVVRLDPRA